LKRGEVLRGEAEALEEAAKVVKDGLKDHTPVEEKKAAWVLEDEAQEKARAAVLVDTEALQTLRAALSRAPELAAAHQKIADFYRAEAERAEAEQDTRAVQVAEAWVRRHDHGKHTGWLAGMGRVTLLTTPPGATVSFHRYQTIERRLVAVDTGLTAVTPIVKQSLPAGSYLAQIEHPDRETVKVPLVVPRDGIWDNRHPCTKEPHPIPLLNKDILEPSDCYIPGGWSYLGSLNANNGIPRRRIWLDGFIIRRFPVTNLEFIGFLNDLIDRGESKQAEKYCPRERDADGIVGSPIYHRQENGYFFLGPDSTGDVWEPQWPVCFIDWYGAVSWCCWESERTGHPWRLPGEYEREKASVGVDNRTFSWGNHPEPTWCNNGRSQPGRSLPACVGAHPIDKSPYGVYDMSGNMRDWCLDPRSSSGPTLDTLNRWPPPTELITSADWYSSRGGNWAGDLMLGKAGARFFLPPNYRMPLVGVRATRSLIPTDITSMG